MIALAERLRKDMATPNKASAKKPAGSKPSEKKAPVAAAAPAKRATPKPKTVAKKPITAKTKPTKGKTEVKTPPAPRTSAKKEAPVKKKAKPVAAKAPAPAAPPKIVRPVVDPEWLKAIREMLVQQRQRLLDLVQSTAAQMAERTGDLPDVSDRASEGTGDELAASLMAIESAQLDEIEAGIRRIDNGSYGICLDCGKAIPRKRLEILPFAQRCLNCKGMKERQGASLEGLGEEEGESPAESDADNDADAEDRD
jgi:RNA polymerase-binding protein DksA